MSKLLRSGFLAACGWLASTSPATAADRPSAAILAEIDAIRPPTLKSRDEASVQAYMVQMLEASNRKDELTRELLKSQPDHARLPDLLGESWFRRVRGEKTRDKALKEVDETLAKTNSPALKAEGSFVRAVVALNDPTLTPDALLAAVDRFIVLAPKDERSPALLQALTQSDAKSPEFIDKIEKRLLADYPDSGPAEQIKAAVRLREGIGKPIALEFNEARTGSPVSIEGLKGKVVVLDFWATWCGPCVAEMPKMKELYAKYHDQGVEFIGVSLDQPKEAGGLDKLKEYVAKNEIPWPQYYQGNGWESDFSRSWGINAIPALFVVDAEGKLASTEARGKLETLIPELLEKAKAKPVNE